MFGVVKYGDKRLRLKSEGKMTWVTWLMWGWFAETIFLFIAKRLGGVGLAASQLGWRLPLFVAKFVDEGKRWRVFWNPTVMPENRQSFLSEEGCLSIPNFSAKVVRNAVVTLQYTRFSLNGPVTARMIITNPCNAAVVQHENDHLNGVLFVDHLPVMRRKEFRDGMLKGGFYEDPDWRKECPQ